MKNIFLKDISKTTTTFMVLASSFLLQGCFSNDDSIINKDGVKRLPALSNVVQLDNGVVEKNIDIKIGSAIKESEWLYTDNRPAENLVVNDFEGKQEKYSSGDKPKKGTTIISSPVIAEGKIFTLGGQGEIIARSVSNPDEIIWQSQTEKEFSEQKNKDGAFYEAFKKTIYDKNQFNGGNIAYSAGKVFITTKRGNIIVLNASNGEAVWTKKLNMPIRTTPAISGDIMVLTTFDDETYALDPDNGNIRWKHNGIKEKSKYSTSPTPLITGGKVILGYSSGEVFALDINSGTSVWSTILGGGFTVMGYKTAINDIKFSPIQGDGKVYIVSGDGSLNAIDIATGQRLWTLSSKVASAPWYSSGYVFAVTLDSKLIIADAKSGTLVVSKEITKDEDNEDFELSGPVVANGKIVVNDNSGNLYIISPKDGAIESTIKIPDEVELPAVIAGGKIYLLDQKSNLIIIN